MNIVCVVLNDDGNTRAALDQSTIKVSIVDARPDHTSLAIKVNEIISSGGVDWVITFVGGCVPAANAVELLIEGARASGAKVCGGKIVTGSDPRVLIEIGGSIDRFASKRSGFEHSEVDHGQHDSTRQALFCSTTMLAMEAQALTAIGGMDPTAASHIDVDTCWSLRRAGHEVAVEPQAVAVYDGHLAAEGSHEARLRFMLKHFSIVSLAFLLPQYFVASLLSLIGAGFRREFFRFRELFGGWGKVAAQVPGILAFRSNQQPAVVEDRELLAMTTHRALTSRRTQRASDFASSVEGVGEFASRVYQQLRGPGVWGLGLAVVVLLVILRSVFGSTGYVLGELGTPPGLGAAIQSFAQPLAEGLDPGRPPSVRAIVWGVLRLVTGADGRAEGLMLVALLGFCAMGAKRLGRAMGAEQWPTRLLMTATILNPVTLALLARGSVQGLVAYATSILVIATILGPPQTTKGSNDYFRFHLSWGLGLALAAALSPQSIFWALVVGLVLSFMLGRGLLLRKRATLLGFGFLSAFVLNLPSSLDWFTRHTPLIGRLADGPVNESTLSVLSLGTDWSPWLWAAIAVGVSILLGLTNIQVTAMFVGVVVWALALFGVVSTGVGLGLIGATLVLTSAIGVRLARRKFVGRTLGRGQATLGFVAFIGIATFVVPAIALMGSGLAPHSDALIAKDEGRVLWIEGNQGPGRIWVTDGFAFENSVVDIPAGPELAFVRRSLEFARDSNSRLGLHLALAGISHVVEIGERRETYFDDQSDISFDQRQKGSRIWRNEAYLGLGIRLPKAPNDPFETANLAAIASDFERAKITLQDGVLSGSGESIYAAVGARHGWGGVSTAAGVFFDELDGERAAPLGLARSRAWLLVPLTALLALLLVLFLSSSKFDVSRIEPKFVAAPRWLSVPVLAAVILSGTAFALASSPANIETQAWFCPSAGADVAHTIAVVNAEDHPTTIVVRAAIGAEAESHKLDGLGRITVAAPPGAVVESFGAQVVVAILVGSDTEAKSSANCIQRPLRSALFAEGGRAATEAKERLVEKIVFSNPFSSTARGAVIYYPADDVSIAPPQLQDLSIPAGTSLAVDHEAILPPQSRLGTEASIWRGRGVVSRIFSTETETTWTTGSAPSAEGLIPRPATESDAAILYLLNPFNEPVGVTLSGVNAAGSFPSISLDIEASSRTQIDIGGISSATATSVISYKAARPIGAESVVISSDRTKRSLLPLLAPSNDWLIAAAEGRLLSVVNPSTSPVRIRIDILGDNPRTIEETIPASRSEIIDLGESGEFGVRVRSRGGEITVAAFGPPGSLAGVAR